MYICIYIYICIYVYTYIYIHVYIYHPSLFHDVYAAAMAAKREVACGQ